MESYSVTLVNCQLTTEFQKVENIHRGQMWFSFHDNNFGSSEVNCFMVTPDGSVGTSSRTIFKKGLEWDELAPCLPPSPF